MMRKMVCRMLGIACFSVLYFFMLKNVQDLSACERSALLLLEHAPLRVQQVRKIREAEAAQEAAIDFAAWQQQNEKIVQNPELQRIHTVSAISVCGRSDIVLRASSWLDERDTIGCLIDERTALELFGSTNVQDMIVVIDGEEKTIRGILYDVEDTIVYEAAGTEELTNLTFVLGNGTTYGTLQQDFLQRHGISGKFVRMDMLKGAAGFVCLLVPVFVFCRFLIMIARIVWKHRKEKTGVLMAAAALGCFCLFACFLAGRIQLPADMIPTKWSDFSFWADWWERQRESLLLLLLTEKQRPIQPYIADFYRICVFLFPTCIFMADVVIIPKELNQML